MEQEPTDKDVQGLKHLQRLLPLLSQLHEVGCERDRAGNRQLHFDEYCELVLLYLFNPLIKSMRTLQRVSALPKVAKALGVGRFSVGSFSEAPAVFEPERLQQVIRELAPQAKPLGQDPRLSDLKYALTLVDGTVLRALPKLTQTFMRHNRDGSALHGWRLHTHLVVGAPGPDLIQRTTAHDGRDTGGEITHLKAHLEPDRCYVTDRRYQDVGLFNAIHDAQSHYVCRVREDLAFEVVQEKPLSPEALDADVVRDAIVKVGLFRPDAPNHPVRLVVVQSQPHPKRTRGGTKQSDGLILILTDLLELDAQLVALIYLYRWTIELFFRFLKQVLGLRHLLSQRPAGIDIMVYCAVIACLLINIYTGKKPNKAMVEMIGWHLIGLADEQDVIGFLNKPDNTGVKLRAKAELWKKLGY